MNKVMPFFLVVIAAGCASDGSVGSLPMADTSMPDARLYSNEASETYILRKQIREMQSELKALRLRNRNLQLEADNDGETEEERRDNTVDEYINAKSASQTEVAKELTEFELKQISLQNQLDLDSARLERDISELLAKVESIGKLKETQLKIQKRTQEAKQRTEKDIKTAEIVTPILGGTKIYTQKNTGRTAESNLKAGEGADKVADAPRQTVHPVKPRVNEGPQDVFINEADTTVNEIVRYDVLYIYESKDSWKKFHKMLKAFGVKDTFNTPIKGTGKYAIYVGTYKSMEQALKRKKELAEKLYSDHAVVKRRVAYQEARNS